MSDFYGTRGDVEKDLIKISAQAKIIKSTVTEVRVPGNVSGILIPNSNTIIVRVLASTTPDGEPLDQDLRFLRWKTINWTTKKAEITKKLVITEIESRSVTLTWDKLKDDDDQSEQCNALCFENVNPDMVIRSGGTQLTCEIM